MRPGYQVLLVVGLLSPLAASVAQRDTVTDTLVSGTPAQPAAPAAPRDTGGLNSWISPHDRRMLGLAVAATVLLAPADKPVSRTFAANRWRDNQRLQRAASTAAFFGSQGPFLISGALYAAGATGRLQTLSQGALHNMEAVALASVITGLTKGLAGRALPGVDARHSFSFGRGFHDGNGPFVAFPSGHTSAAFAMASTISGEVGAADPALDRFVTPVVVAGASCVGLARVYQHVHWPTDLPLAAAIGWWSGNLVQGRAHSRNAVAKALRGLEVTPASGARTAIGWSLSASRASNNSH